MAFDAGDWDELEKTVTEIKASTLFQNVMKAKTNGKGKGKKGAKGWANSGGERAEVTLSLCSYRNGCSTLCV